MATYAEGEGFIRSIHNLESSYFRTKFESELPKFKGKAGIGVISDTDPQPMMINSHLGRFAIVTVAKINNMDELVQELLSNNMHFSEMSMGKTNPTELVALLIVQGKDFVDGIENVFNKIKGSCSMLILTEDGIIVLVTSGDVRQLSLERRMAHTLPPANQAVCRTWILKSTNM